MEVHDNTEGIQSQQQFHILYIIYQVYNKDNNKSFNSKTQVFSESEVCTEIHTL